MAKIAPDESCPCGSGKSFKDCHGPLVRVPEPIISRHVALQVVPEPAPGSATVFEMVGEGTVFFTGVATETSYDCGDCAAPLATGVPPSAFQSLVLRCAGCGAHNTWTPAVESGGTIELEGGDRQVAGEEEASQPGTPRKTYRAELVRLVDLAVTSDVIRQVDFDNCSIVGPAVVVLLGESSMVDSGIEGTADAVLWEVPPQRDQIVGAIGLENCTFKGCSFSRIGFAGPPGAIAKLRAALG